VVVGLVWGLAAECAAGCGGFALHCAEGSLGAGDGQGGAVQHAGGFDFGAFEAQDFYRRYRALLHQGFRHADFLAQQVQAVAVLVLLGGELTLFLLTL